MLRLLFASGSSSRRGLVVVALGLAFALYLQKQKRKDNNINKLKLMAETMIDVEQGAFVGKDGVFHLGGKPLQDFSVSSIGVRSSSNPEVSMNASDLVGVHLVNKTGVRFVSYRTSKGSWCTIGSGTSLEREEATIVAKGFGSEEENEAKALELYEKGLEIMGRTRSDMEDKALLVFVNPKSGPGKSKQMWETIGKKVIEEDGGHKVEVIITNRANHALEHIRDHEDPCAHFKGIIIVSGDGLIYEVLQGLMARKDWAKCVRSLPVGVLPGGSGNGLAKSVSADCDYPAGPLANSIIVARGDTKPLDVCAVDIGADKATAKRVYSFLSLEFALIADIDIRSEYLRALGEARFTIEGLKRLFWTNYYNGRLSYLPVEGSPRSAKSLPTPPSYWEEHADVDFSQLDQPHTPLLPEIGSPVPESWAKVEDTFWSVWNCNMPWMSGHSKPAPDAHFSDGYIQLQHLRKNGPDGGMSKWKLFKYLIGLDNGDHKDEDYCEMAPTKAYRLEPLPDAKGKLDGIIAIDGEVVDYATLQMQNLSGFMKIFAKTLQN